jgi:hypothetical protein
VRRSVLLAVVVHCPHFSRAVTASRNLATDRLVACSDSALCRDAGPAASAGEPSSSDRADRGHDRPFPRGCPVFPSLAKQ